MRIQLIILSMFVLSCGETKKNNNNMSVILFNDQEFVVIDDEKLIASDTIVEGTGSILAKSPLNSVGSGSHFLVEGALEDASSISLIANASDDNTNGLIVEFTNFSDNLNVKIKIGDKSLDLTDRFSTEKASAISYRIDIHNDETPAHVLIWRGQESEFNEESALFNSEEDGAVPGNGSGSFWGGSLNKGKLMTLIREDPKFEEE